MRLLVKSFLGLVILFALYSAFLLAIPSGSGFPQHATQENDIKAESYLYGEGPFPQQVIVGSSLANRLDLSHESGYFNLAFSGYSVFEGLALILSADSLPHTVWIETNVLMRPRRHDFIDAMTSPLSQVTKKHLPALRAEYQPVTVCGGLAKEAALGLHLIKAEDLKPFRHKKSPALFETLLKEHQKKYALAPDTAVLNGSLRLLKQYVNQLEVRGTRVVFFEMPIHTSLRHLSLPEQTRQGIQRTFPATQYAYISAQANESYETNDGIHLGSQEAETFRDYLLKQKHPATEHIP